MLLLREAVDFSQVQLLTEADATGKKSLFIEGIFAQAEKKNRNGRVYPKAVMEKAIGEYIAEFVDKKRALGEISHPEARPQVKPELASHLITELKFQGNDVYGKAKVLDTPQGQVLRGLLDGGVQMGVSTRALGSVKESAGVTTVLPDLKIFAVDAVSDPSGIDCFVDAINESQQWLITDDGKVVEKLQEEIKKTKLTEERKIQMLQQFFASLK
jgi:hypothetical protein